MALEGVEQSDFGAGGEKVAGRIIAVVLVGCPPRASPTCATARDFDRDVGRVAGSLNSARLLPRDVLAPALRAGAAALIVAHNHPSGEVTPSRADRLVTVALRAAARLLGLPLLDHIILTARSHYSFREVEAWETEGATAAA